VASLIYHYGNGGGPIKKLQETTIKKSGPLPDISKFGFSGFKSLRVIFPEACFVPWGIRYPVACCGVVHSN
jgi:hypothetical protein